MKTDNDYIIEAYETGLHNKGLEELVVYQRKTEGKFKYKSKTMEWEYDSALNCIIIYYDGEEVIIDEFDFEQAISEEDDRLEELDRQTKIAAIKALGY